MTEAAHAHSITVRRLISANQECVFNAFRDPKLLSQWFTPNADISVEVLAFDFSAQGTFRLRYTMPDGTYPIIGGAYEIIEKPHRIVFSWVWEEPDIHANISTRVVVQLVKKNERTEVVINHQQLPSQDACNRYEKGWEGMLGQLQNMTEIDNEKPA
jgi:uncharacterized protein YndB with AHSA1/START domain